MEGRIGDNPAKAGDGEPGASNSGLRRSGRARGTLAERQARVGIVANPNRSDSGRPLPREVWTRWPELRSAKRRAKGDMATTGAAQDAAALDGFARAVRRATPAADPAGPDLATREDPDAPTGARWLRVLLARLALGSVLLTAGFYLWLVTWTGT